MSKQLIENDGSQLPANPFQRGLSEHVSAGTVEIEQARAVAEAQGQILIAKKFPRNEAQAWGKIMEACQRRELAEQAFYAYPRSGETVRGLSIRAAEALALHWGNLEYGIRELSQKDGVSEMQAYCWDLERNVKAVQNFTVRHERHSRAGAKSLTDPRDIYELTANMAARRLRARILAVIPAEVVEAAEAQLNQTLAGKSEVPFKDRVKKMLAAFAKFGVTQEMLEKKIGRASDNFFPEDLAELGVIYNSIKEYHTKPSAWFDVKEKGENSGVDALKGAIIDEVNPE